jgi:hypothetical protein
MSRLSQTRLALLALVLVIAGCSGASSGVQTGADLLSVPVSSSETRAYEDFNKTVVQARAAGETWAADPGMVARRFIEFGAERSSVMVLKGSGEHSSRYEVIAVADGFTDDSVRGRRLDITLERNPDESWRITNARASWRCWPGRGHDDFGTTPCR